MSRIATVVFATVLAGSTALLPAMQLQTPADWKWRTDVPASVTNSDKGLPPNQWFFVAMPPGWHITSNPGVVIYHPKMPGSGLSRLQSQVFLFPGTGQEEYGVFLGGQHLEQGSTAPAWTAFVARRDGRVAVLRRAGDTTTALVDWKVNDAALAHPGEGTARNTFTVDVSTTDVTFSVNDKEVARLPKAQVPTDGQFGFRAGANLNLHVTSLDAMFKLAPVPVK